MKMLDFNALQQPTWPVKLKDEAQTVVTLSAPTVGLMDRLLAAVPDLEEAAKTKNTHLIRKVYDLVADLMTCNEDGYAFTADELMSEYKMTFVEVLRFTNGYMEFIQEINNAKN